MKKSLLLLALVMFSVAFAHAQSNGTISGTITDTTGAVVSGAKVTAKNLGTSDTRIATTDASGHYTLPLLPIGNYNVTTSLAGFKNAESSSVRLETQQSLTIDFKVQPSSVDTEVTVASQAPEAEVQKSDATLGQVIHEEQVANLPLNGRNFVQLALLGPGTVKGRAGGFLAQGASSEVSFRGSVSLSAQGMRENANDWLLDGTDNNELTAGGVSILPSIDAIREFKVLTYNYSAQYGSRGGTTVLVSTKSGSNQFHGSLFEFLRNDVLDARNYFDGPKKGKYIQNEYGASLGGPIFKDKTFFFADFQGNKIRQGLTILSTVPTALMRQGIFTESFPGAPKATIYDPTTTRVVGGVTVRDAFVGNAIPAGKIDPIGQALINIYPLPTFTDRLANNYLSNPVKTLDDFTWDFRLDHNFSEKDRFFGRFSWDNARQFLPSGLPGFGAAGAFSSTQTFTTHARNVAVSETHIISPTTLNQLTIGYNRDFNYIRSFGYGTNQSQKLGIPGANLGTPETSQMTQITVTGFNALGDRQFSPFQGGTNVYQAGDTVTLVRGRHAIDLGFNWRAMQENTLGDNAFAGAFTFDRFFTAGFTPAGALDGTTGNAIASVLMGIPTSGSRNNEINGFIRGRRWKEYRGFVNDTFNFLPNLTLDLGVAYGVTTPVTEAADRFSNFDFNTGKYYVAGQGADSAVGVQTDWSNVEPRIGFAWSPFHDTTTIRGGYGIFHDVSATGGTTGPFQNPPYANAYAFTSNNITATRTLATGFPDNSAPVNPANYTGDLHTIVLNYRQGLIQQWNLNIQEQLPAQIILTMAYTGTHGTRLQDKNVNLNPATPGSGFNPAARRPYPQLNSILAAIDHGWLTYHGLQVKAEKRTTKGLYVLASYTWSHAITNGLRQEVTGDPGVNYYPLVPYPDADKGSAATDLRHSFSLSYVYELPVGRGKTFGSGMNRVEQGVFGGWQVNGIAQVHTGFPLGMQMSSNQSGSGVTNRPNQVCSGQFANPNINEWFDITCFVAPPTGTLGTARRSQLVGPKQVNLDFSVYKAFPITEGSKIEFRSEFFNILNHAQFAPPAVSLGTATFGKISSTVNSSRQIQFALKYVF